MRPGFGIPITTDVDLSLQKQLEESGKKLCSTLFPSPVMKCILKPEVKHIYIGSDLLNHFPFVLLPGLDGSPLFKNCTLSHVSSSSELLQQVISARLFALEKEQQQHEQTPAPSGSQDDQVEPSEESELSSPTLQPPAAQVSKYICEKILSNSTECYIFLILIMISKSHSQVSHCGRHLQTYGSQQFPE